MSIRDKNNLIRLFLFIKKKIKFFRYSMSKKLFFGKLKVENHKYTLYTIIYLFWYSDTYLQLGTQVKNFLYHLRNQKTCRTFSF